MSYSRSVLVHSDFIILIKAYPYLSCQLVFLTFRFLKDVEIVFASNSKEQTRTSHC